MLLHVLVVLVGGVVVWRAGSSLSRDADALAASTGLGRAFVGVVVLGVATSLPEIATTVTAGLLDNPQLVTGNLMGGVALQTVVLVVADAVARDRPVLSHVTRRPAVVQSVGLLALLVLAIVGMLAPTSADVLGVGLWTLALVAVFGLTLVVVQRVQARSEDADDDAEDGDVARPPLWRFAAAGAAILVAGYALARSADELSRTGPLNATFLGAVLVAVATSLPEVSTVVASVRARSYDLAVSNILGTNALEVALLAVGDLSYRGGALLSVATRGDVLLAGLSIVLTSLCLASIVVRPQRTVLGLGPGTIAVVVLYLLGIGALALV